MRPLPALADLAASRPRERPGLSGRSLLAGLLILGLSACDAGPDGARPGPAGEHGARSARSAPERPAASGPSPATPTGPPADDGSQRERPPVIVVIIDTLRADHLGCYGYDLPTSPDLDQLAGRCTLFETNSSQCNATFASITSLFTGLYPKTHLNYFAVSLPGQSASNASRASLAERLGGAGYQTLAVVSHPWWKEAPLETAIGRGWDVFSPIPPEITGPARRGQAGSARATTNRALALLAQRDPTASLFLWVHYFDPHTPYDPPPELRDRFLAAQLERVGLERYQAALSELAPAERGAWISRHAEPEQAEALRLANGRALYDGEIADCDQQLGRLLDALEQQGLLDPSLLVLLADHGENMDDERPELAFTHARLYEGVVRVPLLIKRPGQRLGARCASLTQSIDVLPTVLELLGLPADPTLEGRSLVPLLSPRGRSHDAPAVLHQQVFAESSDHLERMLRNDEYKLTDPGTGRRDELYRWRLDPRENHDLLADGTGTAPAELVAALSAFRPRQALDITLHPDTAPYELTLELEFLNTRVLACQGPVTRTGEHSVAGTCRVADQPVALRIELDRLLLEGRLDLSRPGDHQLLDRVLIGSTPVAATRAVPIWTPRGTAPDHPRVVWSSRDDLLSLAIPPGAARRARLVLHGHSGQPPPELLSSTGFGQPVAREGGHQWELRAEPCDGATALLRLTAGAPAAAHSSASPVPQAPPVSQVVLLLDDRWPTADEVSWSGRGVAADRLSIWLPRDGELGAALRSAAPSPPPPGALVLTVAREDQPAELDTSSLDAEQLEQLHALGYLH